MTDHESGAAASGPSLDVERLREAIDNLTENGNFPLAGDSADDLAAEYARLGVTPEPSDPEDAG